MIQVVPLVVVLVVLVVLVGREGRVHSSRIRVRGSGSRWYFNSSARDIRNGVDSGNNGNRDDNSSNKGMRRIFG